MGALDYEPYFSGWVRPKGCKEEMVRLRAVHIDDEGLYYLDEDVIEFFLNGDPDNG